jgi:antitoxin (DNA-binding transcriptional repressor) of toxin-antitoxin stability system
VGDTTIPKLHRVKAQVSYLEYPDFDVEPHPALATVVVARLSSRRRVQGLARTLSRSGAASHPCYAGFVAEEITQRELRNDSGAIMRALDRGDSFVVTRNGVPVGELVPFRRRQFVRASAALSAFAGAPTIDATRFRAEVDALIDQDVAPRG